MTNSVPLASAAELFCDGDWVESKDQDPCGDIRLIQLADIGDGYFVDKSNRYMNRSGAERLNVTYLKRGDILVARMPDPLGRCCIFPFDNYGFFATVVDVAIIRVTEGHCASYVRHMINSPELRNAIENGSSGTTRKRITRKKLGALKIPLPPLPEQKRIAAILDAADALRQKDQQLIDHYTALGQSLFLEMFGDSGGENVWPVTKIEELAKSSSRSMRTGPFGSDLLHSEFKTSGDVMVLGIENVVNNKFLNSSEPKYITREKFELISRYQVFPKDVLVTIMGTLGRVAVVPDGIGQSVNTKHLAAISVDDALVDSDFLAMSLKSDPFVTAQLRSKTRGAIMSGLNLTIIKGTKLRLPPIELQRRWCLMNQEIEELKLKAEANLQTCNQLFGSLLQRAFKGEKTTGLAA